MKVDSQIWFEQAEEHCRDAEFCLNGARYGLSLYSYHQALEKIFKAAIVEFTNKIPPKSHQLDFLLKEAGLTVNNPHWFEELAIITQHFWRVRYPDIRLTKTYSSKEKIKQIVINFQTIYLWVKNKLINI